MEKSKSVDWGKGSEEKEEDNIRTMFSNYSQDTTLHAVNHISDKERGLGRRYVLAKTWRVLFD